MNDHGRAVKQKKYLLIEKFIVVIIMFMFVLLIGFNTVRAYNYYIMARFSEFNAIYDFKGDVSSRNIIEIGIEENKAYPMLEIIINGELFDYNFEENNQIIITVYDGDVIQINGSMYDDNIKIGIKDMSPGVGNILNNNHIILKENISTLAIIKI